MKRRIVTAFAVCALILTLFAIITVLPINVDATTIYVGGSGPGNYTTIQAAIDAASSGDTIRVHAGTYHGRVTVNKSVSLIGENADTTVIEGGLDIITIEANSVNLTGFTVMGTLESGITVIEAQNVTIAGDNFVDNNGSAIMVVGSRNIRIIGNSFSNSLEFNWPLPAIYFSDSENSTVADNAISWQFGRAIQLWHSRNITLDDNVLTKTGIEVGGDELQEWNTHTIDESNTFEGRPIYYWKDVVGGRIPDGAGQIILANVTGAVVENQSMMSASPAINLGFSNRNVVNNNTFGTFMYCIRAYASDDNVFMNNTAAEPPPEPWRLTIIVDIIESEGETLKGNQVTRGTINIEGEEQSHWSTHSIDSSNMVNHKPVQYWGNAAGVAVPEGAGLVILANCTNMTVENQDIDDTLSGITLAFSRDSMIASNTVRDSSDGVYLFHSENNTIDSNLLMKNGYGIRQYQSNNNTIRSNTISENWRGIAFWDSYAGKIYHNNFIDNTQHMEGLMITPDWRHSILDDGYPSGGNYWSDYEGEDKCKGPDQKDCSGSDRIGDTAFRGDRYPLMEPYGSTNDGAWIMIASAVVAATILMCVALAIIVRRKRRKSNETSNPDSEQKPGSSDGKT